MVTGMYTLREILELNNYDSKPSLLKDLSLFDKEASLDSNQMPC